MSSKAEQQVKTESVQEKASTEVAYDGIKVIQEFMLSADIGESPININLTKTVPITLPILQWHHHDLPPKKMKCTNTGHTLIMSAKWHQERPYVSGGPLFGNYVFSQLHFHWGKNDMEGSEHAVDGSAQPLEMHVVLFKSSYMTQEAALKKRDGIVVIVYFFKLQAGYNNTMELITDAIPYIQMPHSSARLDPLPLSFLTVPFEKDYFMYWGTVTTSECTHVLLWLISREPIGISSEQLETFRSLLNVEEQPLQGNFRPLQDSVNSKRTVFHANPSYSLYSTLLPIRKPPGLYVRRPDMVIRTENDKEALGTEVFRIEPKHVSPFKEEKKETNCNKYTINTSIRVNPDLLQKLKPSKSKVRDDQRNLDRKETRRSSSERKSAETKGCLFDSVSFGSNTSRPHSPAPKQPDGANKKEKPNKKPSLIPRRIRQ